MDKSFCMCQSCQSACKFNPGWFKPGEAEKAADLMGMTLKEFFDKYLSVNWWDGDGEFGDHDDTFVLAPSIVGHPSGDMYPADPRGRCVFYDTETGKCQIYAARPFECAAFLHDQPASETHPRHHDIAVSWKEYQDQIKELLGKEPEASTLSWFDAMLGSLSGG